MSTPPLKLWQVLKEEYESFHGQEGVEFYLKDPQRWAEELCNAPRADRMATYIKDKLSDELWKQLAHWDSAKPLPVGLRNSLVNIFHTLLGDESLSSRAGPERARNAMAAARIAASPASAVKPTQPLESTQLARLNVLLLETMRPDVVNRPNVFGQFSDAPPTDADERAADNEHRLRGMYHYVRAKNHAALCLSGGGIRSATFNLGILQGLARHRLLDKFHYLSTVSGGGFIGGWLSSWIERHPDGVRGVVKALAEPPREPLDPDPPALAHLRTFSNYLSPKVGLLSADTWTMVATVVRNVFLNWLVFVPVLAAMLMLPRLWAALLRPRPQMEFVAGDSVACFTLFGFYVCPPWGVFIGFLFATAALLVISLNLPSLGEARSTQLGFFFTVLLPLLVAAISLTIWWQYRGPAAGDGLTWKHFVWFAASIITIPWVVFLYNFIIKYIHQKRLAAARTGDVAEPETLEYIFKAVVATVLILIAQAIAGLILWQLATGLFLPHAGGPSASYAIFSVPVALLVLGLGGMLMSGFTSRFTEDGDQEWWARFGAWIIIASIAWVALSAIVLYGPMLFDFLAKSGRVTLYPSEIDWEATAKVLGTVIGVVSGAATLLGGFSSRTPANEEEARQAGATGKAMQLITGLLAPISLTFLYILIAVGTNLLLTSYLVDKLDQWESPQKHEWRVRPSLQQAFISGAVLDQPSIYGVETAGEPLPVSPLDHVAVIQGTPLRLLALMFLAFLVLAVVMGILISTNRFSLHFFWRNRIVRAYLGATRPEQERDPHPFTGFDAEDNINMYKLRGHHPACAHMRGERPPAQPRPKPDRLLHVLNIALNLTGSDRLAWQERKAESFTVSPLHAGSHWLGYRRACEYTDGGITLGSAVAISGAFASPNMGYMMTSPVVRFIMTIFNVRFGWWLGNPGDLSKTSTFNRLLLRLLRLLHGGEPYTHDSPALSVIPIVQEAFGMTDDRSPYVYLSDGGHFENFGLYEMVLRRCRFIVVSDASTDPKYAFGSLGQSIRQIRVDLGVPIELRQFSITGPGLQKTGKYCAVGTIRYSCVDGNPTGNTRDVDGTLIYIKPALTGTEPRDVLNYAEENKGFPQEFIGDQWFTESQFESYRALGSHIVDEICGSRRDPIPATFNFKKFEEEVSKYNGQQQAATEEQVEEIARPVTPVSDETQGLMQPTTPQVPGDGRGGVRG